MGKCLTKFLPKLIPGFIGGAFHPLLQIGFGVEYEFPNVVAEGLAYICAYYFKIGEVIDRLPADDGKPSVDALAIAKEMKVMNLALPRLRRYKFPVDELVEHYSAEVAHLASKWKIYANSTEGILKKLAELSRAVLIVTFGSYRDETLDFFLIHGVTSLQAVRVLIPHLSLYEQKRLLQVAFVGFLGNMWLNGMPDFDVDRIMRYGGPLESNPWETIIDRAIACDDEHVGKTIRALVVMRDSIPEDMIPQDLLQRAALMTTNFIKTVDDWNFKGIGFGSSLKHA